MAGIFNGPVRGGTRGGRDQFSWDNVKNDKEREYYLGHSVKALTGRWQKGRDVYWYTRDVERGEEDAANELAMVKQREQDLMMEALGVKPKAPKQLKQPQLDKGEMQKLLQGTGEQEGDAAAADADRVKGLGFHASMTTGAIQAGQDRETLAGVGAAGGGDAVAPASGAQQAAAPGGSGPQQGAGGPALTAEQIAELKRIRKKQEKKAAKKAKKEARKAKKKAKKEKEKKRRRSPSSSSSGGSSIESEGEGERRHGRQPAVDAAPGRQAALAHGLSPRRGLGIQQQHQQQQTRSRSRLAERPQQRQQQQRSRSRSPARRSEQERRLRSRSRSPRRRHDSPAPRQQEQQQRRQRSRSRSPHQRRDSPQRRYNDRRQRSRSPRGRR